MHVLPARDTRVISFNADCSGATECSLDAAHRHLHGTPMISAASFDYDYGDSGRCFISSPLPPRLPDIVTQPHARILDLCHFILL